MTPPTRRSCLATLGATTAALAGCSSASTGTRTADETPRGTTTDSSTPTPTPDRVRLEAVKEPTTIDGPVTALPSDLRSWLRETARTGEKMRAYAETGVYVPEPALPAFEHVRLETPDGDGVDGVYELTAEGGTRYHLLVGASTVDDVPGNATATPITDLPDERRELARLAIEGSQDARVYPETALGEWVRHDFFGGYYSHDGTTYLGTEVEQTDAAFFSTTAWYVLSLSPAPAASTPTTFRLPRVDPSVRQSVSDLLAERGRDAMDVTANADDLSDAAVAFLAGIDYLLAHSDAFAVSVER